ncbi:MAG: hypothetical protein Q4C91_16940 [Eubacteriales bacterium]|nr:hypothetical protein [Eubacteriales bacterium]
MNKLSTVKKAVLSVCMLLIAACMFLCFMYAPVSGATPLYWISSAVVSILAPIFICGGIRCILYWKKGMEETEKK